MMTFILRGQTLELMMRMTALLPLTVIKRHFTFKVSEGINCAFSKREVLVFENLLYVIVAEKNSGMQILKRKR